MWYTTLIKWKRNIWLSQKMEKESVWQSSVTFWEFFFFFLVYISQILVLFWICALHIFYPSVCIYFIPVYGLSFKNIAEFYLLIFCLVFLHLYLWEILNYSIPYFSLHWFWYKANISFIKWIGRRSLLF